MDSCLDPNETFNDLTLFHACFNKLSKRIVRMSFKCLILFYYLYFKEKLHYFTKFLCLFLSEGTRLHHKEVTNSRNKGFFACWSGSLQINEGSDPGGPKTYGSGHCLKAILWLGMWVQTILESFIWILVYRIWRWSHQAVRHCQRHPAGHTLRAHQLGSLRCVQVR